MSIIFKYLRNPWVLLGIVAVAALLLWKYRGALIAVNIPNALPSEPGLTAAEKQKVRELAMRLHDDMDGIGIGLLRDSDAWQELMSMSDSLFVAVNNDFNRLYFKDGKGTMRQWLSDEWTWVDFTGVAGHSDILERMASLNLN